MYSVFSLTISATWLPLKQHWIKDEKFGKKAKDEEGFSSFALINKATGQAIKHSIGVTYPVCYSINHL